MARAKKTHPVTVETEIAVVGGGPSGRTAALCLARKGFRTVLVAPREAPADGRTTALWQKSLALLEDLGVWPEIAASAQPLKKMRMIDATGRLIRAPETTFDSAELGLAEFGYNIVNSELNAVLDTACAQEANLTLVDDLAQSAVFRTGHAEITTRSGIQVAAQLAVAADGRSSLLREAGGIAVKRWSYPQVALVLNLEHSRPHQDISTEFHTPTGPFTLVPLPGRRSSLVCVVSADEAEQLKAMSAQDLAGELERRAHSILGRFKIVSGIQSFPLSGMTAEALVSNRLALIGETAHVFPPIGAQGLNLSLRDVSDLADVLVKARHKGHDIGSVEVLTSYQAKRFADIRARTNAVDLLNRSLLTDFLPVQAARSTGLYLAGKIAPLRRLLMREGMTPGSGFQLRR